MNNKQEPDKPEEERTDEEEEGINENEERINTMKSLNSKRGS